MGFGQSIASFFRNYVGFSGRAQRSEYWFTVLFLALVTIPLSIVDLALFEDVVLDAGFGPLTLLLILAILLPGLALTVRRFHDVGLSGWLVLLGFIPFLGSVFTFVISLLDSQKGTNRFGPSGKYPDPSTDQTEHNADLTEPASPLTLSTPPVVPVVPVSDAAAMPLATGTMATSTTATGTTTTDQLTRLAALHEQGKLSDREFEQAKAKLLG